MSLTARASQAIQILDRFHIIAHLNEKYGSVERTAGYSYHVIKDRSNEKGREADPHIHCREYLHNPKNLSPTKYTKQKKPQVLVVLPIRHRLTSIG